MEDLYSVMTCSSWLKEKQENGEEKLFMSIFFDGGGSFCVCVCSFFLLFVFFGGKGCLQIPLCSRMLSSVCFLSIWKGRCCCSRGNYNDLQHRKGKKYLFWLFLHKPLIRYRALSPSNSLRRLELRIWFFGWPCLGLVNRRDEISITYKLVSLQEWN